MTNHQSPPVPYQVTIIYVTLGKLHIVNAYPERALNWRFGDCAVRDESELLPLLEKARAEGALVVDERADRPDQPILISYRVPQWHAQQAVTRLDRAIYANSERGIALRRSSR